MMTAHHCARVRRRLPDTPRFLRGNHVALRPPEPRLEHALGEVEKSRVMRSARSLRIHAVTWYPASASGVSFLRTGVITGRMRSLVVCLGLVACSTPSRSTPSDAAVTSDGAVDGIDAVPAEPVTVTVNSRSDLGVVVPGAPVVFIDPDQTVTYAHTDAAGVAQAIVKPGASVTVIYDQDEVDYRTVLDVQPGDQLVFGTGTVVSIAPTTVTFTAYPDASATYLFQCSCGARPVTPGTTPLSYQLCIGPIANTDAYVIASVNNAVVATAAVHGVSLDQPIVVPNVWTPATALAVSYASAPGRLTTTFQDAPEYFSTHADLETSPYAATLKVPADGTKQFMRTDFEVGSNPESIWEALLPGASTYHLDLSNHLLPAIGGVTYDQASRTVAAQGAPTIPNSLVMYSVAWGAPTNPETWTLYTHTLAPAAFPVLPADLRDLTAFAGGSAEMVILTTPALTNWDQVRANLAPLTAVPRSPAFDFFQSELVGL